MKLIRISYYFFYFAPETRNTQCLRQQLQAEHIWLMYQKCINFEISPFHGQSKWLKEKWSYGAISWWTLILFAKDGNTARIVICKMKKKNMIMWFWYTPIFGKKKKVEISFWRNDLLTSFLLFFLCVCLCKSAFHFSLNAIHLLLAVLISFLLIYYE